MNSHSDLAMAIRQLAIPWLFLAELSYDAVRVHTAALLFGPALYSKRQSIGTLQKQVLGSPKVF